MSSVPDTRSRALRIVNPNGLHARPASLFVTRARRFRAMVEVECHGRVADGRSVLSILTLAATEGTTITITARGEDAAAALAALCALVEDGFADEPCR